MKLSIFLLAAVFIFSSCEKGHLFKDKDDKTACFKLAYPVSYLMPDGYTITGEDETGLDTALKDWYLTHPDSEDKPVLQYPVNIVFEDETNQTVADEPTLIDLKKDCHEEEEKEDKKACFDFVYPVNYTMSDGATITGDDVTALETAMKAWYEANPDAADKGELLYPVELVFEDGTNETVDNEAALKVAYETCE